MGIDARLRDAGRDVFASVTDDGEQIVSCSPHPPIAPSRVRPFRQFLTVDGASTSANDMGVNGSVTPVDFWVPASIDDDRYITALSFEVGYGTTAQPYQWADGAALTNGSRLYYDSLQGEVDIHDGIKTNQGLLRLSLRLVPTAWEVRGMGAVNDYGYMFALDLMRMGMPFGIKLDRGSSQRLVLTVRDNATNADVFNVIAYGFDRFE